MNAHFGFARAGAIVLVLMLAAPGMARSEDNAKGGGPVTAKAAFERLKSLVGAWSNKVEGYPHAEGLHDPGVTYRLTAAGSALIETDLPGSDHEMVSVYHLDGEDLRLTHYCAAGNQPRLKLDRANSTPSRFVFVFDGGTNLKPEKDIHIHGLVMTFRKDGHVECSWDAFMDGKSIGATVFDLSRRRP